MIFAALKSLALTIGVLLNNFSTRSTNLSSNKSLFALFKAKIFSRKTLFLSALSKVLSSSRSLFCFSKSSKPFTKDFLS